MNGAWNEAWAAWILEELVRNGVDCVCVAPGSRSTPLAVAAARHGGITTRVHTDERAVGFYALGWARATGRAAAVITTSGTAVANLAPAVAEASQDRIPLVLLTADRPPELRATDANQTLIQPGIFGPYVRWAVDMPCPTGELPPAYVLTTVDQACYRAHHGNPGPVHLNLMVREPFLAKASNDPVEVPEAPVRWREGTEPYTVYAPVSTVPAPEVVVSLAAQLDRAERGVLLVGHLARSEDAEVVAALANALQWPLLPDLSSHLRLGPASEPVMAFADWFGGGEAPWDEVEFVLHVGGRFISKTLARVLADHPDVPYAQLVSHPDRHDPGHRVSLRLEGNEGDICRDLQHRLSPRRGAESDWSARWATVDRGVERGLTRDLDGDAALSEPWVARQVVSALPAGHGLVVGNSRPVRDVLRYAARRPEGVPVCLNRGASGIDGLVATTAGYTAAIGRPVTLLIGDLSLLHDLTSLALVADLPVTVVVVNNDGGGIFHSLPIAETAPDVFETFFAAPHGRTFAAVAEMFGLHYRCPSSPAEFRLSYAAALAEGGGGLVEVRVSREAGESIRRGLETEVRGGS